MFGCGVWDIAGRSGTVWLSGGNGMVCGLKSVDGLSDVNPEQRQS